ncbi:MAG: ABC transporter permease [Actinomycetia bacterium]|nr:ABC transporter permease [Actinomycetes bacterium]
MSKTITLFGRLMKHITRSPDTIITVCITPIGIMLMFVYVMGGAVKTSLPAGMNYVSYLLPGILLITIASGTAYTTVRLFSDVATGLFSRFNSMPIKRSAMLWSHVMTSVVSNLISVVIVILVALTMGFRSSAGPLAWLAVAGLVMLFTLTLTWIAVIPGLVAKTVDGAGVYAYPLIFLPFISSAFVPTATMPAAVRAFAENQPVTSIVNTIRALLMRATIGSEIWVALAWCIGIMAVAYVFAMRIYRRRV